MIARLRSLLSSLADAFWLLPSAMIVISALAAVGIVELDRSGAVPDNWLESAWLYNGAATGARTLLGVVAASTIGIASTTFSITIAALSLAVGQMGPRLLRNFTRDRKNQFTLGVFLGTFSYALLVLRSVRVRDEGEFVPHLALSVGMLLALASVIMLVFFVGHIANRINVDTVINLVSADIYRAIRRLMTDKGERLPRFQNDWIGAIPISANRQGYLQQLDKDGLADWAEKNEATVRLLVRAGSFISPGAIMAFVNPPREEAEAAVRSACVLSSQQASSADLEYEIRQLVEVAVRALSPSINDPHTAMSILDRLGAALCEIAPLHFSNGIVVRNDRVVLISPSVDYNGVTDTMFHMIRQSAAGVPAVLIKILEVLITVLTCEANAERVSDLRRHADLVISDAERTIKTPADLADVRGRYGDFERVRCHGVGALLTSGIDGSTL